VPRLGRTVGYNVEARATRVKWLQEHPVATAAFSESVLCPIAMVTVRWQRPINSLGSPCLRCRTGCPGGRDVRPPLTAALRHPTPLRQVRNPKRRGSEQGCSHSPRFQAVAAARKLPSTHAARGVKGIGTLTIEHNGIHPKAAQFLKMLPRLVGSWTLAHITSVAGRPASASKSHDVAAACRRPQARMPRWKLNPTICSTILVG